MSTEVKLPDLGEGIDSAEVVNVLVEAGQSVKNEQDILEIETDKATVTVPSSAAGEVEEILVEPGQSIQPGQVVLKLKSDGSQQQSDPESAEQDTDESAGEPSQKHQPEPSEPKDDQPKKEDQPNKEEQATKQGQSKREPEPQADSQQRSGAKESPAPSQAEQADRTGGPGLAETRRPGADIPAGPAVRKLARQLGVDLRQVEGSGSGGRIQQDDLFRAVREHNLSDSMREDSDALHPPADAKQQSGSKESDSADAWGPIRRDKLSKIRATIAETLARSASTIPHVTHFDSADITELEKFRQQRKNDLADENIKLTMLPFVIKAVCECLRRHTRVNATLDLDTGEVIYKDYVSIGIAVDSDRGLVVPVLRNAGDLAIAQLARGLNDLAGKVRDNDYTVDDLRGGTFTISNQGAVGGQYATPIINPPQSAILLVGRGKQQPTVTDDGQILPRLILPLSFSYDHRLIDGADAGRFVNDLVDLLENPGKLLLRL